MNHLSNIQLLVQTAKALVADQKGLVAIDESIPNLNGRFALAGIPETAENRRAYRELLITTEGLQQYITGAILFDETVSQQTLSGIPFLQVLREAGIIPGIKVDAGTEALPGFPGEKITLGLDQLTQKLSAFAGLGLKFAKWRAVIQIEGALPTEACMRSNAHALARYAAACQQAGIVPIVEPEVIMDGDHGIERCAEVTEQVLRTVFEQLYLLKVELRGMILKPNMILPGKASAEKAEPGLVAEYTANCLLNAVPPNVSGIAFLSGGQDPLSASRNLNALHTDYPGALPWPVTYSFSRALHQPALEIWGGKPENVQAAQASFLEKARNNYLARKGEFKA